MIFANQDCSLLRVDVAKIFNGYQRQLSSIDSSKKSGYCEISIVTVSSQVSAIEIV